ncbi:hypothetical protein Vi05172_g3026 [Venturia inaequalis]|nr:hypothetical protein Vi05172_g3026 [Venturia inaequalis]
MFGMPYRGNNYIHKEKEPEWTKIQELLRCLETRFLAKDFALEINVRMNTTIPTETDDAVKANLTIIFKRFWTLVKASKLEHVVVNFVRYDTKRPKDMIRVMVLTSNVEETFQWGLEQWFLDVVV